MHFPDDQPVRFVPNLNPAHLTIMDLHHESDLCQETLLELIKADSDAAFTTFYIAYHDKICGYAHKLTQSREQAQDIAQDVFLKM